MCPLITGCRISCDSCRHLSCCRFSYDSCRHLSLAFVFHVTAVASPLPRAAARGRRVRGWRRPQEHAALPAALPAPPHTHAARSHRWRQPRSDGRQPRMGCN